MSGFFLSKFRKIPVQFISIFKNLNPLGGFERFKFLNMEIKMKRKKYLAVTPDRLAETQKILMAATFELEEIWTPDDDDEFQIWSNPKNNTVIEVKVVSDEKDATRKDVVNEIIDVWYEVRSIREVFDALLEEESDFVTYKEEDFYSNFENKVKAAQIEWEQDKEKMNFLYKNKIDPRVLTYLSMDDDEKARITN